MRTKSKKRYPKLTRIEKMTKGLQEDAEEVKNRFVVKEHPRKGRGVFLRQSMLKKDSFALEYDGDIITQDEAKRREEIYEENQEGCFIMFFTYKDRRLAIDATRRFDSLCRLLNHSRRPNIRFHSPLVIDLVECRPRIAAYALRDIYAGEEIVFDYGVSDPNISWLKNKEALYVSPSKLSSSEDEEDHDDDGDDEEDDEDDGSSHSSRSCEMYVRMSPRKTYTSQSPESFSYHHERPMCHKMLPTITPELLLSTDPSVREPVVVLNNISQDSLKLNGLKPLRIPQLASCSHVTDGDSRQDLNNSPKVFSNKNTTVQKWSDQTQASGSTSACNYSSTIPLARQPYSGATSSNSAKQNSTHDFAYSDLTPRNLKTSPCSSEPAPAPICGEGVSLRFSTEEKETLGKSKGPGLSCAAVCSREEKLKCQTSSSSTYSSQDTPLVRGSMQSKQPREFFKRFKRLHHGYREYITPLNQPQQILRKLDENDRRRRKLRVSDDHSVICLSNTSSCSKSSGSAVSIISDRSSPPCNTQLPSNEPNSVSKVLEWQDQSSKEVLEDTSVPNLNDSLGQFVIKDVRSLQTVNDPQSVTCKPETNLCQTPVSAVVNVDSDSDVSQVEVISSSSSCDLAIIEEHGKKQNQTEGSSSMDSCKKDLNSLSPDSVFPDISSKRPHSHPVTSTDVQVSLPQKSNFPTSSHLPSRVHEPGFSNSPTSSSMQTHPSHSLTNSGQSTLPSQPQVAVIKPFCPSDSPSSTASSGQHEKAMSFAEEEMVMLRSIAQKFELSDSTENTQSTISQNWDFFKRLIDRGVTVDEIRKTVKNLFKQYSVKKNTVSRP